MTKTENVFFFFFIKIIVQKIVTFFNILQNIYITFNHSFKK